MCLIQPAQNHEWREARGSKTSQTDPVEEAAPFQLGIPEVMAAIIACQAALANKTEAVQLDTAKFKHWHKNIVL